ncbi:unnamed protein product [Orchesella dallaii]|uniref:Uncharacterized protein n=1 Tax=Orchesella dallaii TaxID=48710 RepID=A0ABP1RUM7_9HEXA
MEIYKKLFLESREYLVNLKVFVKGELKPILQTGRKTAIVGLLVTIVSLESIMEEIVAKQKPDLIVLRSRFGHNNNPNSKHLMHALKGILCTNTKCINTGNFLDQEVISTKASPWGNYSATVNDECNQVGDEDEENELHEEPNIDADASAVISNVVDYVSGYVVRKICDNLKCPKCVCKLMADTEDVVKIANDCVLILHKVNGWLVYPSYAVVTVCKMTETTVRESK